MSRIRVYAQRRNTEEADRLADALTAEGHRVVRGDARYFKTADVDRKAEIVYHDGTMPALVEAYEAEGAELRLLSEPEPAPEPQAVEEDEEEEVPPAREDCQVVKSGNWYSLIGPDGEKIGKSQHSESDAWQEWDRAYG